MRVGVIGGGRPRAGDRLGLPAARPRRHRRRRPRRARPRPQPDLVIPGPEAALVAGVADECAAAGVPCFGPTADARPAGGVEGLRPRAGHVPRHPRPGVRPLRAGEDVDGAWRGGGARPAGRRQARRAGRRQGRHRAADDAETLEAHRRRRRRPVRARGADERPGVLAARAVRRPTRRALPLAQDHKRIGEGDTGANTGGMGAYAPAPLPFDARRAARPRSSSRCSTTSPPPARRTSAVLYAGLMLTARRTAAGRVQRPLRRSRGPGRAAAAATPTSPRWPSPRPRGELATETRCRSRPGAACAVVAAAARLPRIAPASAAGR